MEYRLLEKTELWISPLELRGADLDRCARVAGEILGLKADEIMVIDAPGDCLTMDILAPVVRAEQIVAREKLLLAALASVPGVVIIDKTRVHSEGVLGLISLDESEGREMLTRSKAMQDRIAERIKKRALVLATGPEVLSGQIQDTNTPFLMEALGREGFRIERGPVVLDKVDHIAGAFRQAADRGFGLVVSTGGVGAEGKDQTLEALTRLDPEAFTPYVLKFHPGHGRHQKDGVRLGVGRSASTTYICLPGPHDEVKLLWSVLRQGLKEEWNNERLAQALAGTLRRKFMKFGSKSGQMNEKEFLEATHDLE